MEITKIDIPYFHKDGLDSDQLDGIRHVKTLPFFSVVQALEGSYDIQLGNGPCYNTGTGGFFLAPSNMQQIITHHSQAHHKRMVCRWVFIDVKINGQDSLDALFEFPVLLSDPAKREMNSVFDRLFASEDVFMDYICYYEIIRILLSAGSEKKSSTAPYLKDALRFMQENHQNPLTVKAIARAVNLSEAHLFAVFKKQLGISPIAFLNNYRLSLAVEAMVNSDKTITEIAQSVGIKDVVYFNKLFRKTFQMPPTKYRTVYEHAKNNAQIKNLATVIGKESML